MFGWLFLWKNVRICNLSIKHAYRFPSLSFNVSRSSGNSNSKLSSVTSNFGLGLRKFECTAAQCLRFLQSMIMTVFLLINFNKINRNYCLNKTTLILFVVFLLSVSIYLQRLSSLGLSEQSIIKLATVNPAIRFIWPARYFLVTVLRHARISSELCESWPTYNNFT